MVKDSSIYQKIDIQAKVEGATPERLIQLLYENILLHLQQGRAALMSSEPAPAKSYNDHMIKAIESLSGLRDALDFEVESNLPYRLDNLYDYLQRQLLQARLQPSIQAVDESIALVETLKEGWDTLCH